MEFASPEAAQEAHDKMQGQTVDGRQIYVDYASELRDGAPRSDFRRGAWRGGGGGGGRGGVNSGPCLLMKWLSRPIKR